MDNEQPNLHVSPDPARREAMRAAAKRMDRVNGWLHLGGALPAEEYERFVKAGVTHIVDLREEEIPEAVQLGTLGISRRQVPVPNGDAPTLEQLRDIDAWFPSDDGDSTVYVHCAGGFGRAATMTVGLLIQRGATLDEALQQVRAARPEIRLNDAQLAWLRAVEEQRPLRGWVETER